MGKVEEVDVQKDESGWGSFLRVQIYLDLTQPLARGRTLKVKGNSLWIPFSYEKLATVSALSMELMATVVCWETQGVRKINMEYG